MSSKHQHINPMSNTSTHQHIKTSTHQNSTSKHQHNHQNINTIIKTSTQSSKHQHIKTQHINTIIKTSTHQHIKTQHINTSTIFFVCMWVHCQRFDVSVSYVFCVCAFQVTCATDTVSVQRVFNITQEIVLKTNLRESKIQIHRSFRVCSSRLSPLQEQWCTFHFSCCQSVDVDVWCVDVLM